VTADALIALRDRVKQLLRAEQRAMHTGDIAARLAVPTHQIHTAMHVPLQRGEVWFRSSEGYSLPKYDQQRPTDSDAQPRLA
jgi:hypothetical protein